MGSTGGVASPRHAWAGNRHTPKADLLRSDRHTFLLGRCIRPFEPSQVTFVNSNDAACLFCYRFFRNAIRGPLDRTGPAGRPFHSSIDLEGPPSLSHLPYITSVQSQKCGLAISCPPSDPTTKQTKRGLLPLLPLFPHAFHMHYPHPQKKHPDPLNPLPQQEH